MSKKEYCGDCLYDDIWASFYLIDKKLAYDRTGELISKIQPPLEELREEKNQALKELKKAIIYLDQGKKIFMPNTKDSFVDEFLEKHKDLLE